MSDNKLVAGEITGQTSSVRVATDEATYSGDSADIQLVRLVHISGAEGSKTVDALTDATGIAIRDGGNVLSIDDAGASVTVDAPVGTPVYTRLSDGSAALVGQKAMTASLPVVVASDQSTIPVSLASVPSHAVTNAGTFAVQDSEKVADNAAFTDGTTKVLPAGYIFDEVAGTALTENDAAAARVDSKRAQVLVLEDETTRGRRATVTAGNALKVDGSAVTQPVSDAAGSLTVDAPVGTPVYVRLSDGAANLIGQKAMTASVPVVLASDQSAIPVTQSGTWDEVGINDSGNSITVDAPVATPVYVRLSDGAANLIGQKAMTASVPVVLASDQSTVAVSLASVPSHAVTNAGTFAVQDSEKVTDNNAFTDGTTKVQPAGFIFDEVAGTALTENDTGAARMDSKRALVGTIEDATTRGQRAAVSAAGALKVDGSAVTQPVSLASTTVTGTVAVTQSGTWDEVGINDSGNSITVDAPVGTPVFVRLSDGTASLVGQKTMAASLPVVIASDQSAVAVSGSISVSNFPAVQPVSDNASSLTVDAPVGTPVYVRLSDGAANLIGQKAMTASVPVVIASDQSAVAVSGTVGVSGSVDTELPAAVTLAENLSNPTTPLIGGANLNFDGTVWDRWRNTDATDGNAALTTTGIGAVGVGPGFARRFDPSNLGTAANSTSAVDVNGAGTAAVEINTSTSGTFTFEVTVDGTTWVAPVGVYDVAAATFVQGTNLTPAVGKVYLIAVNGMRQFRLRTVTTLGATTAHKITLSLGDAIHVVPPGGQKTMAASISVTVASDQTVIPVGDNAGSLTVDAPVGTPVYARLSDGSAALVGQKAMTASLPVVLASDQSTLAVSLASVPSHAVTNAGTFAVQDSEKVADNAAFTDGTTKVLPAGFIYDETAGTALTENDAAAARINVNRAQVGVLEDGATRGRYATVSAANALKVDGSAVTQPVSLTSTTITGTVAVTDNAASLTVDAPVGTPVYVRLSDGAANLIGQKAMTASIPVVLASDQSTLAVSLASVPSHAVTNAGTFAVQDSEKLADNAGFTDGTTKVLPVGFIYDETAGTALTENDAAAARINVNRAQVATIEDGATRGRYATVTAANAVKVDGSGVTQPVSIAATVTVDTELPAASALNGTFVGTTSAPLVGAAVMGYDGTNFVRLSDIARYAGNGQITPLAGVLAAGIGPGFNFRDSNTVGTAVNSAATWDTNGAGTCTIQMNTTTTGTVTIEVATTSGVWIVPLAVWDRVAAGWVQGTNVTPDSARSYVVSVRGMRQIRVRTVTTLGATITVIVTMDHGDIFTMDPATVTPPQQIEKALNYTTTQTGGGMWTPTSGKKIAITSIVISSYGTTAGRVLIWFGASADTTYTAGTDQLVLPFNTAPSTSSKPGIVFTPATPIYANTADHVLRITTDAAISLDISVYGYEF